MAIELVMFGGIVFWVLFGIISVVIITCVADDRDTSCPGVAAFILCVWLIFMGLCSDSLGYAGEHPVKFLLTVTAGYIIGGVIWAIPKWFFILLDLRRKIVAFKSDFLCRKGCNAGDRIPKGMAEEFQHAIDFMPVLRRYDIKYDPDERRIVPPKFADENRDRILITMCFWPWDAFWTLLKNPIRWFFEGVLDMKLGIFQKMSDMIFSGFDDTK